MIARVLLLVLLGAACAPQPRVVGPLPLRACSITDAREFPAPPADAPPAPGPSLRVGTAHPAIVVASAPDARWTVLCQAREDTNGDGEINVTVGYHGSMRGDAMRPYLVMGDGDGEALDDLVDGTPDGRHLAVVRDGRLLLIDTVANTTTDLSALGADATVDRAPFERNRAGSFDARGERFVWIRGTAESARAMVRSLRDGTDRALAAVPGRLDRAWVDPGGAWLVVRSVTRDTDGDGRLTPPRANTTLSAGVCRGPVFSYSGGGTSGDAAETWIAPAAGGSLRSVRELAAVVGPFAVLRRADGALDAVTPDGAVRPWTPADCKGRVVALSRPLERALVVCSGRWRGAMSVHGDGVRCALPDRADPFNEDEAVHRFVLVRQSDHTSVTVDLARAARPSVPAASAGCLPTVWGHRDCAGDVAFVLPRWLLIEGRVVDVGRAPLAVDRSGRVLLPARDASPDGRELPLGPLTWRRSAPAADAGAP